MKFHSSTIRGLRLRSVLNSAGALIAEVVVTTDRGETWESSPTGTTTGRHDQTDISQKEISRIFPTISRSLIGVDVLDHKTIDSRLRDILGERFGKVRGPNLSTAVSFACVREAARVKGVPLFRYIATIAQRAPRLPRPLINVINGGFHNHEASRVTECMLMSKRADTGNVLHAACRVFTEVQHIVAERYGEEALRSGIEGGVTPRLREPHHSLDILRSAIDQTSMSNHFDLAIDLAASNMWDRTAKGYRWRKSLRNRDEIIDEWSDWSGKYPELAYLEDPLQETDISGWTSLTNRLGKRLLVCGDDLISTNPKRLIVAARKCAINAVILKINQAGCISDLLDCAKLALDYHIKTVVSHRSQETDSDFVAHLGVGIAADFVKFGCCARERIVKWNTLARIADIMTLEAAT